MRDKISNYNKMKNEEEKIDNQQGNGVLPLVSGSYLRGIGHIHDSEMVDFAEKNNKTMDELILDMVDNGWTQGRDVNGEIEYWEG